MKNTFSINNAFLIPEESKNIPPPPPSLNGGLYTGEEFMHNAPWRNHPSMPDASFAVQRNLQTANPPPGATFQPPGTIRQGNNVFAEPAAALGKLSERHALFCVDATEDALRAAPKPRSHYVHGAPLPERPWFNACSKP